MASKTYYETIRGKVKWCRNVQPNKFGRWSVDVYLDNPESMAKWEKLKETPGVKNSLKQDEDGKFVTFSRDTQKTVRGKMVLFDPPFHVDANDAPAQGNIGNGSDCDVVLQVYSFGGGNSGVAPGRAARFHGIKVYNLVAFEPMKDYTEQEITNLRGLNERPPMDQW